VRFDDSKIEEIKSRVDIVELVSEYLTLKKAGRNYLGLCPFHQEKTPSFTVNREKHLLLFRVRRRRKRHQFSDENGQ